MTIKSLRKPSKLKALLLGCSLALMGTLPQAHAAMSSQSLGDIGGLVGAAFNTQDIGTHVAWGLTGHYTLMPQINVGLYYERFTNDTEVPGGTKFTTSFNWVGAEANYLFSDLLQGAYAGGRLGWAITSVDLPNRADKNNLIFGPQVGYDYMIGNGISLGGQLNLIFRTGDPFITNTNLLAVLKYNFS